MAMFNKKGLELVISSDPQYEELCSEIYVDGQFVAIITREHGLEKAIVQIYPPSNAQHWTFAYSDFLNILNKARDSLVKTDEIRKPPKNPEREKFQITVASLPHREELAAKIYYENEQWVEISNENDELIIRIYPASETECWEFPLEEALEALEQAKRKLY